MGRNIKKILLSPGDQHIGEIMKEWLASYGFDLTITSDALEALEKMKLQKYDLILLDILMPKLSAYYLLEKMPELNKKTKVGILTRYVDKLNFKKEYHGKVSLFLSLKKYKLSILAQDIKWALGDLPLLDFVKVNYHKLKANLKPIVEEIQYLYESGYFGFLSRTALRRLLTINYHDSLYYEALYLIRKEDTITASFFQRHLRVGYARAARILDELCEEGYVSGPSVTKPRVVLKKH